MHCVLVCTVHCVLVYTVHCGVQCSRTRLATSHLQHAEVPDKGKNDKRCKEGQGVRGQDFQGVFRHGYGLGRAKGWWKGGEDETGVSRCQEGKGQIAQMD